MNVYLFEGGAPGRIATVPGENPEAELAELLEGEITTTQFGWRFLLVQRADGEDLRLPIQYAFCCTGREPVPIAGDCAVVARSSAGRLRNLRVPDLSEIEDYVRPTGVV